MSKSPKTLNLLFDNQINIKQSILKEFENENFFYALSHHIFRIKTILTHDIYINNIVELANHSLSTLINTKFLFPENYFIKPNGIDYQRYLLYFDKITKFIVMAVVWPPKSSTPIHDHGTWGVVGVLKGKLSVINYELTKDSSNFGNKSINKVGSICANVGDTTCVFPPVNDIHMVSNAHSSYCISIHTYGNELKKYNIYNLKNKKIEKNNLKYNSIENFFWK